VRYTKTANTDNQMTKFFHLWPHWCGDNEDSFPHRVARYQVLHMGSVSFPTPLSKPNHVMAQLRNAVALDDLKGRDTGARWPRTAS
jgi:hypothetical protein